MSEGVQIGQRVWVTHEGGRVHGRVASVSARLTGFVVVLDGTPTIVITCDEALRGTQWDFAADSDAF